MAAVVFAIGSRPRLLKHEAFELADLLARRRTLAATSAGRKIGAQGELDQDASADVVLEREELAEVLAILEEPRWPEELESFARLRVEIAAALGRRT